FSCFSDHCYLHSSLHDALPIFFALRHVEVVKCSGNLCSHLVELFGCDMEVFMRFVQVLARVLKGSAGHLAEPECPHEFKAWQLARLVPFLQGRVHIEFRILDDFVAEAVNDHADGVDTPDPFVKTLLCHWKSLLKIDILLSISIPYFLHKVNDIHYFVKFIALFALI